MAIQHDVQRLCYNNQIDSWIFISTKGTTYGYTLSDSLVDIPGVLSIIMEKEADVKAVISRVSTKFYGAPHSPKGIREKEIPQPNHAK
jgi:hypothetical protein